MPNLQMFLEYCILYSCFALYPWHIFSCIVRLYLFWLQSYTHVPESPMNLNEACFKLDMHRIAMLMYCCSVLMPFMSPHNCGHGMSVMKWASYLNGLGLISMTLDAGVTLHDYRHIFSWCKGLPYLSRCLSSGRPILWGIWSLNCNGNPFTTTCEVYYLYQWGLPWWTTTDFLKIKHYISDLN